MYLTSLFLLFRLRGGNLEFFSSQMIHTCMNCLVTQKAVVVCFIFLSAESVVTTLD